MNTSANQSSSSDPEKLKLPRILCVDDEPIILETLDVFLSEEFEVYTETSGAEGLRTLKAHTPFAVVISDMQMPEMDGATFLHHTRKASPDTIRILLTGQADVESAISAINKGNIFRFLRKPCPPDELMTAVRDAMRQYELTTSERILLEETLAGTVKIMTEIMSLATPIAFRRTAPLKSYVNHMCEKLDIKSRWDLELAATLAQVGCITLPPNILDKYQAGQALEPQEQELLEGHPAIGLRLLSNIPRLERVAKIVGYQNMDSLWSGTLEETNEESMVCLGANMLATAQAFDKQILNGKSVKYSCTLLKKDSSLNPILVSAMESYILKYGQQVKRVLKIQELLPNMTLDEDVMTITGQRILVKGSELTVPLIERLCNFSTGVGIEEPIRVLERY